LVEVRHVARFVDDPQLRCRHSLMKPFRDLYRKSHVLPAVEDKNRPTEITQNLLGIIRPPWV